MRQARYWVYLLLATLLLLELGLQVGHLITVSRLAPAPDEVGGAASVLCVGDSFTFGIGAGSDTGSYPAALERLLKERLGSESDVVNAGWPGQNSHEIGSKLEAQIEASRPEIVVILAGTNDRWSRAESLPALAKTENAERRFELEYRTGRLLRLLFPASGESPTGPSEPQLEKTEPAAKNVKVIDGNYRAAGWELLREKRYEDALRIAKEGVLGRPEHRATLIGIQVKALVHLGRQAEALELLPDLETIQRDEPTRSSGIALIGGLADVGRKADAVRWSRELVEKDETLALAWQILGWDAIERGSPDEAIAAFERLVSQDIGARWKARSLRALAKAVIISGDTSQRASVLLFESLLLDENVDETVLVLRHSEALNREENLRSLARGLDLDERGHELMDALITAVNDYDYATTLEHNLLQMIDYVRAAGSTPLILGYPDCREDLLPIQRRAADSSGTRLVLACDRFAEELQRRPREELFVADGHCTEAGYALLAEAVAAAILEGP